MNILKVKNLTKTFDISDLERKNLGIRDKKKVAVDHIKFTVKSGEVLGLLGPNGAGKTTTMRMLAALIKPDEGQIYYNDLLKDPMDIRADFAFLTTDLQLDVKSTPNELFDFFAKLYHIPKAEAKERKAELFERFGINTYANTKIGKLSQGMYKKLSLVISVLHDPEFIIFDEPTNGLDIIVARDIISFILDMKVQGKCVIISTHLFDLAEKVCDRIAMIVDGKIITNKRINELRNGRSLEDAFYDIYTDYLKSKESEVQ